MSAAEKMSRRDEMETLLPFYLNGSLEGAELEAVEEWLSSDPAAMAALGEAEAEFSGTARSLHTAMRKRLREAMQRRCAGIAAAHDCELNFIWEEGYPPTTNDPVPLQPDSP